MCTIEKAKRLTRALMQASIAFMVPSERPSGRGKRVSTSSGEHRKKSARFAPPWRWSQGQHPAFRRGLQPRALRRPVCIFHGCLPPNPREACLRREAGRSQTILYGRIRPISGELPKGTSKLLPLPQENRRLTAGIVFSGNRLSAPCAMHRTKRLWVVLLPWPWHVHQVGVPLGHGK
jgi:hypothetical protein